MNLARQAVEITCRSVMYQALGYPQTPKLNAVYIGTLAAVGRARGPYWESAKDSVELPRNVSPEWCLAARCKTSGSFTFMQIQPLIPLLPRSMAQFYEDVVR